MSYPFSSKAFRRSPGATTSLAMLDLSFCHYCPYLNRAALVVATVLASIFPRSLPLLLPAQPSLQLSWPFSWPCSATVCPPPRSLAILRSTYQHPFSTVLSWVKRCSLDIPSFHSCSCLSSPVPNILSTSTSSPRCNRSMTSFNAAIFVSAIRLNIVHSFFKTIKLML